MLGCDDMWESDAAIPRGLEAIQEQGEAWFMYKYVRGLCITGDDRERKGRGIV